MGPSDNARSRMVGELPYTKVFMSSETRHSRNHSVLRLKATWLHTMTSRLRRRGPMEYLEMCLRSTKHSHIWPLVSFFATYPSWILDHDQRRTLLQNFWHLSPSCGTLRSTI